MNNKPDKSGFTLVEILMAMTIIVTIISMVYGSYFITSKSVRVCQDEMLLSRQGQMVLMGMSKQIRCSFADYAGRSGIEAVSIPRPAKPSEEIMIDYFSGNCDAPSSEILHLVTTSETFGGRQKAEEGLFEVTYRFDKTRGILFVNSKRFVGTSSDDVGEEFWRPIAKNIKAAELSFFDGREWLGRWDFRDSRQLPCAVKIEIVSVDENGRQCYYSTIANLLCWKNRAEKTQADILVSVGK